MRYRLLPVLAALVVGPGAHAAPLLTGETELHVEAQGTVKAMSAVLSNKIAITKHGKDNCEKEVSDKVAAIRAQVAAAGLPPTALTLAIEPCAEVPKAGPVQMVSEFDPEAVVLTMPTPPNADAAEIARRETARKLAMLPRYQSAIATTLRVDDLAKLQAANQVLNMTFAVGPYGKREFHYSRPEDLDALAYADGLAKARAQADVIAKELGAHVVRIARVSNHGGPLALNEAVNFFAGMAQQPTQTFPSVLGGAHTVSVAIDYMIAPN
jgi:uncharacterized protein YggE